MNQATVEYEPGVDAGSHAWTTSLEGKSQTSEDLGPQAYLTIEFTGNTTQVPQKTGTTDGAGDSTTLVDSGMGAGVNDYQYMWVLADDSGTLAVDNLRRIASNTATDIVVSIAFTAIPGASTVYTVLTGAIRTGTLAAGAASTATVESDIDFALNELALMQLVITGGTGAGQRRSITSNTAGVSSVITVDHAWDTTPDATSTYALRFTEVATGTVAGAAGVATSLDLQLQQNGAITPSSDKNITITSAMTINDVIADINSTSNWTAALGPGAVSGLTLMNTFDFGTGALSVDLRNDLTAVESPPTPTVDPPAVWANRFRRDLQVLVDSINNTSEVLTAARSAGSSLGAGANRPEFTGGTVANQDEVTALALSGGTRGASTDSSFQTALDLLLTDRANFVVPLISEDLTNQGYGSTATFAAVAAQLASHVQVAAGNGKSERGGALGMSGTKAQIIAQANILNEEDIQLCGQKITTLNVASSLVEMDEWAQAVQAVGMRSGAPEVGEPLTYKYFNTTALTNDASWDPTDDTDANAFIKNGVLFGEPVPGKGFRWARDLTTWSRDDNLALAEGSTRDAVRYVAYGLRTFLEEKFTGDKAKPGNVASIKDQAGKWLEEANSDNIIVASLDENDVLVPNGFHKLRVTISGDIATIKVEIFPVTGINFQLNDISLQLPRLAA
jgi:hypothetical protein